MNHKIEPFTEKEYFHYFNELCCKHANRQLLVTFIQDNCNEMEVLLKDISAKNCFQVMAKILRLDEQLQIVEGFIDDEDLSDRNIIDMSQRDYKQYFIESLTKGYSKNNITLHMLSC